jgi:DNA-binding YbaB/EbfC family protein
MTDETDPTELAELESAAPAGLGGLDLGALLGAAQNMQEQLAETQERIAATIVEGHAGGGAVTVSVTGAYEFQRVVISPDAVDPDDHSMLEDLLLAALRDAASKIADLQADADPLAGMREGLGGLGGLGDLFGGG